MEQYIPCMYKKSRKVWIKLAPTKLSTAITLVKKDKAVFVNDRIIGRFLKIKYLPTGRIYLPECNLGIDPGSMFDGYSVVSKDSKIENNLEVEHTWRVKDNNYIKNKSADRRSNRRTRRSRLRHRKIRFANRTSKKITSTANYYYQSRRNMINRLRKYYNIREVIIEDVKFAHKYDAIHGKSFSNIEIGKTRLYNFIEKLGLTLAKVSGTITKKFRDRYSLFKTKNKAAKEFSAHCVDSFSLASLNLDTPIPNFHLTYISRNFNIDKVRRLLVREKNKIKDARFYKRKTPHLSKLKKIRVKVTEDQGNHGPWTYMYTEVKETFHKFISNYKRFHSTYSKFGSKIYSNLEFI